MQLNRNCAKRLGRDCAGFSAMEVMVALALGLLVVATVSTFNRSQLFALRNQAVQNDVQMAARNVVDLFARETRRAGLNPLCIAGMPAVTDATAKRVRVQADLNRNGAIDGGDEVITYRFMFTSENIDRLEREANGQTDVLIDGVDLAGSRFRFYDAAGAEIVPGLGGLSTAQRAAIRRVRIEFVLNADPVDPESDLPLRVEVANDVDIRNRHFVNAMTCS
jgi:type II secretory pathway component PulJ